MTAADVPNVPDEAVEKADKAYVDAELAGGNHEDCIAAALAAAAPDLTRAAIAAERERALAALDALTERERERIATAIEASCSCEPDDHDCEFQKAARIARAGGNDPAHHEHECTCHWSSARLGQPTEAELNPECPMHGAGGTDDQ